MSKFFRQMLIIFALMLMILSIHEFRFKNSAQAWKNNPKPQAASYLSLDEDQIILKDLEHQTRYSTYKMMDPLFFSKPTIFDPIKTP